MAGCWIGCVVVISLPFWLVAPLFCQRVEAPKGSDSQVKKLLEGTVQWNEWREVYPNANIRLDGFDISYVNLRDANLYSAFIARCDMTGVDLAGSSLVAADAVLSTLLGANLCNVDAREAGFHSADLSGANLSGSDLTRAGFSLAKLVGANLNRADFSGANLVFADLRDVENWQYITGIRCANIYGVSAPRGFRQWALDHGALEYERDAYKEWLVARDACLAE